jgi:hypothetical protein
MPARTDRGNSSGCRFGRRLSHKPNRLYESDNGQCRGPRESCSGGHSGSYSSEMVHPRIVTLWQPHKKSRPAMVCATASTTTSSDAGRGLELAGSAVAESRAPRTGSGPLPVHMQIFGLQSRNWRIRGLLDRPPRALPSCWRRHLPPTAFAWLPISDSSRDREPRQGRDRDRSAPQATTSAQMMS